MVGPKCDSASQVPPPQAGAGTTVLTLKTLSSVRQVTASSSQPQGGCFQSQTSYFSPMASTHTLIHTLLHKSSTFTTQAVEVALWGPSHHPIITSHVISALALALPGKLKSFECQLESCVCAGGLGAWPQLQGATVSIVLFCNVHLHAVFQMFHVSPVLATNQAGTSAEDLVLYVCADLPLLHWFKIKLCRQYGIYHC